ncbi:unnamed protein product, partial [Ectocarpus sp. 12 AP-2014]
PYITKNTRISTCGALNLQGLIPTLAAIARISLNTRTTALTLQQQQKHALLSWGHLSIGNDQIVNGFNARKGKQKCILHTAHGKTQRRLTKKCRQDPFPTTRDTQQVHPTNVKKTRRRPSSPESHANILATTSRYSVGGLDKRRASKHCVRYKDGGNGMGAKAYHTQ